MYAAPAQKVDASRMVLRGTGLYYGGTLKSTGGGASTVDVYDGQGTGGQLIASFAAASSGVDRDRPHTPIAINDGCYVALGSNVSVFVIHVDDNPDPPAEAMQPYQTQ